MRSDPHHYRRILKMASMMSITIAHQVRALSRDRSTPSIFFQNYISFDSITLTYYAIKRFHKHALGGGSVDNLRALLISPKINVLIHFYTRVIFRIIHTFSTHTSLHRTEIPRKSKYARAAGT